MLKRYRVSGERRVLGHEPGERFEADLDPTLEERLFASRVLQLDTTPDEPDADADGPETADRAEKEND